MIDISIIILSYNGKDLLARTLDSVFGSLPASLKVETIVVDNASTDGSVEMVNYKYSWVKLIPESENLGFSKGNNRGVSEASGRFILFLNSDTEIYPGVLENIYTHLVNDPTVGIATCRVVLMNGEIDPASHRGFPTPWRAFTYFSGLEKVTQKYVKSRTLQRLFGGYHLIDRDYATSHEVDACTGAFMMMPRSVGDQIEWWSEDYFMYGEDLDICYKVRQLGLRIMYYPDHKILHLKHASGLKKNQTSELTVENASKVRAIKVRTTSAFYDAMIIFYEKFYRDKYPLFVRQLVYLGVRLKKLIALRKIQ